MQQTATSRTKLELTRSRFSVSPLRAMEHQRQSACFRQRKQRPRLLRVSNEHNRRTTRHNRKQHPMQSHSSLARHRNRRRHPDRGAQSRRSRKWPSVSNSMEFRLVSLCGVICRSTSVLNRLHPMVSPFSIRKAHELYMVVAHTICSCTELLTLRRTSK